MEDLVNQIKQNITEIDPQKAKDIMTNSSVTIIDVREENEFNAGHIDQAVLLPRGVLEFKIRQSRITGAFLGNIANPATFIVMSWVNDSIIRQRE
jgi:rhodanese-related sulfurtransferase